MTTPSSRSQWQPSPVEVAALIARLLPDAGGMITGAIGPDTIPTEDQVSFIIDGITAEVELVAPGLTPAMHDAASRVVSLGTGAQVAESFFPEARAEYVKALRAQYETALARLVQAAAAAQNGPVMPVGYYPPPQGPVETGLLGWYDPVRQVWYA